MAVTTPLLVFLLAFALSCSSQHTAITLGVENGPYEVECNEYKYFSVDVVEPCMDLRVQVFGRAGEPNLYVSRYPTLYPTEESLAWTSYNWGDENLTISSWDPSFEVGTFYVGVQAFCSDEVQTGFEDAVVILLVESVRSVHPDLNDISDKPVTGTLAAEGYHYYKFCVPRECVSLEVILENCLDPEECPTSYAWPELLVSHSIPNPTIYDLTWKLATVERRKVSLDPSHPNFHTGHFYVGVYGWCTPAEHCPDKSACGPCEYAENTEYTVTIHTEEIPQADCKPKTYKCEVISEGNTVLLNTFVLLMSISARVLHLIL
ncbi:uncharacterized protein [Ptychodera flava]|uniref:uncharacterized protein n=1 Tax=Ptychodera flava TaxID=63121 RepID=UPI00396A1ACD